ncbi:MAG: AMIN domain-containing protein [Microcoleaceae cyanobacterium]
MSHPLPSSQKLFLSNPVSWMAIATVITTPALVAPAQAAMLRDWKFDASTGQVEVLLPDGVTPRLAAETLPGQLVLDLPNTEVGIDLTEVYETGVVRQITLTQFEEKTARIVIDFAPGVVLDRDEVQLRTVGIDNTWILRPAIATLPQPVTPATTTVADAQTPEVAGTEVQIPETTVDDVEDTVSSAEALALEETESGLTPPPAPSTLPEFTLNRPLEPVIPNPQPEKNDRLDILTLDLERPEEVELVTDPLFEDQADQINQARIIGPGTSGIAVPAPPAGELSFGEPLPTSESVISRPQARFQSGLIQDPPPNIVLVEGTKLTLVYPSPDDTRLPSKDDRQDVLLLQGGIVDRNGNFIVPPDTPVVGRFETGTLGSRFVAEALNLEGRSIPFKAESEWIDGDLDPDGGNILLDSGIGGAGVFLLSGLSGIGLLVGALGGAAVGLFTSPRPSTLQPGQIVEVQLVEDLRQSEFFYARPVPGEEEFLNQFPPTAEPFDRQF